jgi:hypothetical protein
MSRPLTARVAAGLLCALFAGAHTACRPSPDPVGTLEPVEVITGWFDAGIVPGQKNKLVPSVSLKLRNKASDPISSVQINAIFRRVNEPEMWGEHFGWAVQKTPLTPGQQTEALVLRSSLGYTGEQPRMQMLQNSQFVDAKVEIFLKSGSRPWAKLAEYPIQRQLLTR